LSQDPYKDFKNIEEIEAKIRTRLDMRSETMRADRLKFMTEWNLLRKKNDEFVRKLINENQEAKEDLSNAVEEKKSRQAQLRKRGGQVDQTQEQG